MFFSLSLISPSVNDSECESESVLLHRNICMDHMVEISSCVNAGVGGRAARAVRETL